MEWTTWAVKRAIDVAGASVGLALTAPLFPVVAAAVKLTSPGPVFYRQVRCGAERRTGIHPARLLRKERRRSSGYNTFRMTKFRTMRVNAEQGTGAVLAQVNDPRTTPVGGFLRRTRLDELPQLLHVLRGDMSLVGPRPERPELMAKIEACVPFFQERMRLIKPGITGLAQIRLNYDGSFSDNAESELLRSFLGNLDLSGVADEESMAGGNAMQMFANKLLFDLSYAAILENPVEAIKTDVEILLKTPMVMLKAKGR